MHGGFTAQEIVEFKEAIYLGIANSISKTIYHLCKKIKKKGLDLIDVDSFSNVITFAEKISKGEVLDFHILISIKPEIKQFWSQELNYFRT